MMRGSIVTTLTVALLAGACTAVSEEQSFELFQTFRPSPAVETVCRRLGFKPIPLITQRRFYREREGRVDGEKYARRIWMPGEDQDEPPEFGGWERYGIPPDFDGWVDLDFEKPLDARSVVAYKDMIRETRRLRPRAKICLHGYILRQEPQGERGELVHEIVSMCDAISPPIYPRFTADFGNLKQQLHVHRKRIQFCLDLKARHGVKVFPVMWKRYGAKPAVTDEAGRKVRTLIPEEIVGQFAEMVVTTERNGDRVDGIIVWGNDPLVLYRSPRKPALDFAHPDTPDQASADASDIRFLEIIAAAVRSAAGR